MTMICKMRDEKYSNPKQQTTSEVMIKYNPQTTEIC